MCVKTNNTEKYFILGLFELCWKFLTLNKDGSDNYGFSKSKQKRLYDQHFLWMIMQYLL